LVAALNPPRPAEPRHPWKAGRNTSKKERKKIKKKKIKEDKIKKNKIKKKRSIALQGSMA